MALPSFASVENYTDRFGAVSDETRAEAALSDASTDIRAFIGATMVDDDGRLDFSTAKAWARDTFRKIVCQVAHRRLTNPEGVTQSSIDGYSRTLSDESADVYLKASEKQALSDAIGRNTYGVWTLPTTRSDPDVPDTIATVDTEGNPGEPIAFTYEPLTP